MITQSAAFRGFLSSVYTMTISFYGPLYSQPKRLDRLRQQSRLIDWRFRLSWSSWGFMIRLGFCLMFRSRQKRSMSPLACVLCVASVSVRFLVCFAYARCQKAKKAKKPTQKLATQASLPRLLSNLFVFRGGEGRGRGKDLFHWSNGRWQGRDQRPEAVNSQTNKQTNSMLVTAIVVQSFLFNPAPHFRLWVNCVPPPPPFFARLSANPHNRYREVHPRLHFALQ